MAPQALSEQRRFRRSMALILALGFLALVGVVISAAVLMGMNQKQAGLIRHTFTVEREIANIRYAALQLANARLRHPQDLSSAQLAGVSALREQLTTGIAQLAAFTRDNPRQQARLPRLDAAAMQVGLQAETALAVGLDGRPLIDHPDTLINRLTGAMQDDEQHLLAIRTIAQQRIEQGLYAILALAGLLLALLGLLGFTTIAAYTRELDMSRQALREANSGLEGAVQERTAELQRANSEIQRFAYIVSHDLRSPLVNVMGFTAELQAATQALEELLQKADAERPETVSPEARVIVREDLPEAIHFIRSSTEKMDRLINAILKLSRLGRRELAPEWLDLGTLCRGVVDTLQMRMEETGGTVDIASPLPPVFTDRVALEQIIANLVENALKYSHPDRAPHIRLTATAAGQSVDIRVIDNGRGIAPADHQRIFDLFRRAGPQDRPGEGIGLAHVRALAYRLEGHISLESSLGNGTTFTLHLPRRYSGTQSQPS